MSKQKRAKSGPNESDPDQESFTLYGTALPPLTDLKSDPSSQPLWKQEVRDAQGRQRFHGAFTGGFSAGYYNTVGSKEGWTPSTFVSSRKERAQTGPKKPEDFMDDEDLAELESSRRIGATEEFDLLGGTKKELERRKAAIKAANAEGGGLLSSLIEDMVVPSKDPIGVRLLRRMGWRPGQGIGPRVSWKDRNKNFIEDGDEDEDDVHAKDFKFAPRDTAIVQFDVKIDRFGLGYDHAKAVPEVEEMRRLRGELDNSDDEDNNNNNNNMGIGRHTSKKSQSGGIGIGVLEDDDDDDVYDRSSQAFSKTLMENEDEDGGVIVMLGGRRSEPSAKRRRMDTKGHYASIPSNSKQSSKLCSDGHPPLRGFILTLSGPSSLKWWPPPKIPVDFEPYHHFETPASLATTAASSATTALTSDQRGILLGETPSKRSVFDHIPAHSKEKLDSFIDSLSSSRAPKLKPTTVDRETALTALRGFIPFSDDLAKQARYKAFLEVKAGLREEDLSTESRTPDEIAHEHEEFAKSARIFRPLSGIMAGRFTAAKGTHTAHVSEGGLKTFVPATSVEKTDLKTQAPPSVFSLPDETDTRKQAAAMGAYGPLTRITSDFMPNRLLCKRFNVAVPKIDGRDMSFEGSRGRTALGNKDVLGKDAMDSLVSQIAINKGVEEITKETPTDTVSREVAVTAPPVIKEGIDNDGPELEYERPPMDIFKAIFDASDEEQEEEKEQEKTGSVDIDAPRQEPILEPELGPSLPPEEFRPKFTRRVDRDFEMRKSTFTASPSIVSSDTVAMPLVTEEIHIVSSVKSGPLSFGMESRSRSKSVTGSESENLDDSEVERKKIKKRKREKIDERSKSKKTGKRSKKSKSRKHHRRQDDDSDSEDEGRRRRRSRSPIESENTDDERIRRRRKKDKIELKHLDDGIWVEKVVERSSAVNDGSSRRNAEDMVMGRKEPRNEVKSPGLGTTKSRPRAADLW